MSDGPGAEQRLADALRARAVSGGGYAAPAVPPAPAPLARPGAHAASTQVPARAAPGTTARAALQRQILVGLLVALLAGLLLGVVLALTSLYAPGTLPIVG